MSNPLKRIRVPELGIDTVIEVSDEMLAAAIAEYFRNHPVTVTETDPTVPSWAKQPSKPTYTANEVGALPDSTVIPTVPQMATQTDMSDWTSGKTVDASAMKTVVSAARTVILENSGDIDSLKSDKQNAPLEIPVTESGDTYSTTVTAEQIRAAKENSVFVFGDEVRIKALLWFPLDEGVELLIGMQKLNGTILAVVANVSNNSVSIEVEQTTIPTAVSELTNDSGYQTAQDVQTAIAGVRQLPAVTASDNGKFLRVVSGAWAAETVQTWQGGSY